MLKLSGGVIVIRFAATIDRPGRHQRWWLLAAVAAPCAAYLATRLAIRAPSSRCRSEGRWANLTGRRHGVSFGPHRGWGVDLTSDRAYDVGCKPTLPAAEGDGATMVGIGKSCTHRQGAGGRAKLGLHARRRRESVLGAAKRQAPARVGAAPGCGVSVGEKWAPRRLLENLSETHTNWNTWSIAILRPRRPRPHSRPHIHQP